MISCVLFPVLVQNVYNLFFTNPGRQLFWEDCESMCITGYLLVMMAFDSYKKTKKIELLGLKRPTQQQDNGLISSTGIPKDLSSQRLGNKPIDPAQLQDMFSSTLEMQRFRDVLTAMIHNSNQA